MGTQSSSEALRISLDLFPAQRLMSKFQLDAALVNDLEKQPDDVTASGIEA